MAEEVGEYAVMILIKGKRSNAHFLAKTIEYLCDLAEQYLNLEIKKKIELKK